MRKSYTSGAKWEDIVAYRRAVRINNTIEVSGTTAVVDGEIVGLGNVYEQTRCCFEIIQKAIEGLGGAMSDVIRTRIYTTDINRWEQIGQAHFEFFKEFPPASTMIEISKLIDDNLLVEIEATAIISDAKQ